MPASRICSHVTPRACCTHTLTPIPRKQQNISEMVKNNANKSSIREVTETNKKKKKNTIWRLYILD